MFDSSAESPCDEVIAKRKGVPVTEGLKQARQTYEPMYKNRI
jgi:hypothetical protein